MEPYTVHRPDEAAIRRILESTPMTPWEWRCVLPGWRASFVMRLCLCAGMLSIF